MRRFAAGAALHGREKREMLMAASGEVDVLGRMKSMCNFFFSLFVILQRTQSDASLSHIFLSQ